MKPWLPAQEDGGALEGGVSGPFHTDMNVENLRPLHLLEKRRNVGLGLGAIELRNENFQSV